MDVFTTIYLVNLLIKPYLYDLRYPETMRVNPKTCLEEFSNVISSRSEIPPSVCFEIIYNNPRNILSESIQNTRVCVTKHFILFKDSSGISYIGGTNSGLNIKEAKIDKEKRIIKIKNTNNSKWLYFLFEERGDRIPTEVK